MTTYNDTLTDSIVKVSTISTTANLNNSILELIAYLSTVPTPPIVITVNEALAVNQAITTNHFTHLLDSLEMIATSGASLVTTDAVIELLSITNTLLASYNSTITESILLSSTFTAYLNNLLEVLEQIVIDSTVADKVTFLQALSSLISIIDKSQFIDKIVDLITINNTVTDIYRVINTLVDSIIASDSISDKYIHILSLLDILNIDDTDSNKVINKEVLSDLFIIKLPGYLDNAKYLAYTLAPESMSVTNYTNFNFNNCTKYNNKYLFSNAIGLYEYGAVTDDGALITSYIETAGLTFGTSNLKNVPSFYLGYSSTGSSILRVRVDGKGTFHYKLNKYSNHLETKKMDIGKGLVGRYFQFEIITDAEEFNLESMEFYPVVLKRKI